MALEEPLNVDVLRTHLSETRRVAVYLTLPGCAPCAAVRPWVEREFSGGDWSWVPVNTSQHPAIAGQFLVFAHPTLLLFADGREVGRFSRVIPRAGVERVMERVMERAER